MKKLLLITTILLWNFIFADVEVNIKTRFSGFKNIILSHYENDIFFIVNKSNNILSKKSIKCQKMVEIKDKWGNSISCNDLKILVDNNMTIKSDVKKNMKQRNNNGQIKYVDRGTGKYNTFTRQRIGGLFITLGSLILYSNIDNDCDEECLDNIENIKKWEDSVKLRARFGLTFMAFGGILIFYGI